MISWAVLHTKYNKGRLNYSVHHPWPGEFARAEYAGARYATIGADVGAPKGV